MPYEQLVALWGDLQHRPRERTLWVLLYESAARAEGVLGLDPAHLDLAQRTALLTGMGGGERIYWASSSAWLLGGLVEGRTGGPVFLSDRVPVSRWPPVFAALTPDGSGCRTGAPPRRSRQPPMGSRCISCASRR